MTPLLYIFYVLHQTTTSAASESSASGCISFMSYIKPQLAAFLMLNYKVVYLLCPTSNHNEPPALDGSAVLYIFYVLHQTTTRACAIMIMVCCISFMSYIKPQLPCLSDLTVMSLYIFYVLHQTTTYSGEYTDYQHVMFTLTDKKWCAGCSFRHKDIKKFRVGWAR